MRNIQLVSDQNWHSITADEAVQLLGSSLYGLSQDEAKRRLSQFGPNELIEQKKISPWAIFLGQFKSFLVIILLVAAAFSIALGEMADTIVIMAIVIFAGILGFLQEYKAERALQALRRMTAPTALVVRDGQKVEIPARELVPGDILLIDTGDLIPADGYLLEIVNLRVNEAPLTGESVPVDKIIEAVPPEASIGDRKNLVYMGTAAVYGRGKAIVTTTGMATEFGKIARLVQEVEEKQTPLQANLDRVGRLIGIGALVLCAILAVIGIIGGHGIMDMLIWGIALAVAIVPEALPAVVVIGLALGAQRMARRRSLIRKLSAVETLGSATVICSDKTGTLTRGEMMVRQLHVDGRVIDITGTGYEPRGNFFIQGKAFEPQQDVHVQTLLHIGTLCNNAYLIANQVKGDPTEGSLLVAAIKVGMSLEELNNKLPRLDEIPFSSERKRMTTIHNTSDNNRIAYSKGAPEVILDCCTYIYSQEQERELNDTDRKKILDKVEQMANEGLRVLGIGYKRLTNEVSPHESIEQDMVFVGLAGMIDPPRQEVKQAIEICSKQAGIKPVMITGDHKLTAVAIGKELGLKSDIIISGSELDNLSSEEFEAMVERIGVYARVSPAHKLRIVDAFSKKGHIVAMTGDGVNDAPALRKADIGVAMGITGTEVSKEASHMVLTDDNFASIVAAVEEGRGMVDNIKKYLMYLFSGNLGQILALTTALLAGTLLGLPPLTLPLVATQILFINLLCDGLAAVSLSVDPLDPYIMKRKPLPFVKIVFSRGVLGFILGSLIWTGGIALGIFLWAFHSRSELVSAGLMSEEQRLIEAQSMCFVTLALTRLIHAFNSRSERHSLFKIGPFTNKWLWGAIGTSFLLILMVVYLPPLQGPFHTFGMGIKDWGLAIGLAMTIFLAAEAAKFIASRCGNRK